jgi:hypothetical protein
MKKNLEIFIPERLRPGVFSNTAKVNASPREVVIDFALVEPVVPPKGVLVSRLILTPVHAMELRDSLSKVLERYKL